MKQYNHIVFVAAVVASLFSHVKAQPADGWVRTFSDMQRDTIFIASGGAYEGSYFVHTMISGSNHAQQVVWGRGGFDEAFLGNVYVAARMIPNDNDGSAVQFAIEFHHGDTTIVGDFVDVFGQNWITPGVLASNGLARFDSISIIVRYNPFVSVFTEKTVDFDGFSMSATGNPGTWTVFYNGGDLGSIAGIAYSDSNGNGARDSAETGLANWKMYLSGVDEDSTAVQDSTVTDSSGHYSFSLRRGTYQLSQEHPTGLVQTEPMADPATVVVTTDSLHLTRNFGSFASTAHVYHVRKRWNLVSVPLKVADFSKQALFPGAVSAAFAFTSTGYQMQDTLRIGRGYWVKFPSDGLVFMNGDSLVNDTMSVAPGWNLIGSSTAPMAAANLGSIPPGLVTSKFYGYRSGYQVADTIEPGHGYWVKVAQAGQLIFTSSGAMTPSNRISIMSMSEMPPSPPDEISSLKLQIPNQFVFEQNCPNPFNPMTVIRYQLPVNSYVRLVVYNMLGQVVSTLVDGTQDAGYKSVEFDASKLPSGIYLYKLNAGTFVDVKKMVFMK